MDIETKIELIAKAPTDEIITVQALRELLETNSKPIAYNGFEPSGKVHLGTGLICSYKMKDFIQAGIKFKVYLATWHAWINDKLGGDREMIKKAALHFKHSWIALGVPEDKIEFIWPDQLYDDLDYWEIVVKVAKEMTLARGIRTLEIAGRKESEGLKLASLLYTPMQVADIFHFGVQIPQLGMDQRKANVVAMEVGEKIGFWKPVPVHHHLLQGLVKPPVWPLPADPTAKKEVLSAVKMSKSKPNTAIFIYDEPEEIRQKISKAFCPEKEVENNPLMDLAKYVIFREKNEIVIERPEKFGGKIEIQSFEELKSIYSAGKLHPMDFKNAVAESLIEILQPVREYFRKNKEATETKQVIETAHITR
ncbi:MAG: tyrosine--tRNA ligase [Candidatus Micrarchaeota archaeon]|nr:tyrosine--tRNA ligase [Candidatus Micrarchaeota archaeon]